jgi:peptide chain release factor 3
VGLVRGQTGALQLDVLKARLEAEYDLPVEFEMSRFSLVRWVRATTPADLEAFVERHNSSMAHDLDGALVFLAPTEFGLSYDLGRAPEIKAFDVKDDR